MYGTAARTRVKPENRDALRKAYEAQTEDAPAGFITAYTLFEDDSDVVWMFVVFTDRASYMANADDPRQHEQYVAARALMEEDPEWHDGEIEGM